CLPVCLPACLSLSLSLSPVDVFGVHKSIALSTSQNIRALQIRKLIRAVSGLGKLPLLVHLSLFLPLSVSLSLSPSPSLRLSACAALSVQPSSTHPSIHPFLQDL